MVFPLQKDKFWSEGWFEQGWILDDAFDDTTNEMRYGQYCDKVFQGMFSKMNAPELRKWALKVKIAQKGPGGWRTTFTTYGDYYVNYRPKGWYLMTRVPDTTHVPMSALRGKRLALQTLRKQNWWKPKRSLIHAERLSADIPWSDEKDIETLRDPHYIPNPKWAEYHQKMVDWYEKENPDYTQYLIQRGARGKLSPDFLDRHWKHVQYWYNKVHRVKTPPRLIKLPED